MTPFPEQEELRALLDALCEERITPAEIARVEELVLTRPEAEAYYVQSMGLFAELSTALSTSAALNERTLRHRLEEAKSGLGHAAAASGAVRVLLASKRSWLAACASVFAVAVIWWAISGKPGTQEGAGVALHDPPSAGPTEVMVDENGEPLDNTVAVIRAASMAEWDSEARPLDVGATIPRGRLVLKRGYVELEFYSGATVVLEGPVEFELLSSMEAFCWQGKLRATVPSHAHGFTIGSPKLDLIDRGTEFGMRVNGLESTEVHVFDGKVELYQAGKSKESPPQQELTTGQAMRIDDGETVRRLPSDSEAFLSSQELLVRTQAEDRRRQRAWQAASAGRREDPSVVVYYTFEPEDDWNRTLANQAMAKSPGSDGTVVGCQWTEGRWPGKRALEFHQVSDRVRLQVPGEYETVTMAMWARIDDLPNRFHSLLMTDSWDDLEAHWHIDASGTVELGVQGPERKDGVHYYAFNQFHRDLLGQWVHLAIVYDRANKQVTQYLNGNTIGVFPLALDTSLRFGACELGNWNPTVRKHHHPVRFLTGRIDEFTLYSRVLTAGEIADLAGEN
jgi:hypothetical protein